MAVYVKEELKFKKIIDEVKDKNYWLLGIQIFNKNQDIFIINVYHSPNACDSDFLDKIDQILEECSTKDGVVIIVGDFNINIARNTYYSKKLQNIINMNGLYQLMKTFTRVTNQSSTIIDLLITNDKEIPFCLHHTPKISDHAITTVKIATDDFKENFTKVSRDYKNFNEIQFQLDLMETYWMPNCTDTNLLSEILVNNIILTLNKHAPIVEKQIICKWASKDWWTREIGEQMNIRDQLYRKAIITQQIEDWDTYKRYRNMVVSLIRREKRKYYEERIDESKSNSTEMWKTIKQLVNKNRIYNRKEGIIFNDIMIKNEKNIAESFNTYFLESIKQIAVEPTEQDIKEIINNMQTTNIKMKNFKNLDMRGLREIINNMANKTSSTDGITTHILKLAFEVIGDRFLHTINTSLETGTFPQSWKRSVIIPIEKKRNTRNCEEFRPINMVPVYEKLLERCANEQVIQYIESNNLLTPNQTGFREKNSCESALQTVVTKWISAIGQKKYVGVVFLDLRRAFETINRKLLLMKLKNYGFGTTVMKWFSEYLDNRVQVTKYNNSMSTTECNYHGVPQGTVMGPNLFILYINDIVKQAKQCNIQLFADDTLLYYIGDNITDIVNIINLELCQITNWLTKNSLKVNIEKTKFMILKSRYNIADTRNNNGIYILNNKIEQVSECKYLGIIIDENLTFSSHAIYITKKMSQKVNLLSRVGRDLSYWSKLLIYKSIIMPHIKYCSSILYLLNNTEISLLQRTQNKALRTIVGCDRYTSVKFMLDRTQLLSIKQSIYVDVMTTIYKIKNNLFPKHLLNQLVFVENIHNYETRSRGNFYVRLAPNSFSQNNLFHKGLIDYNTLPNELKSCDTLRLFKKRCISFFKEQIVI